MGLAEYKEMKPHRSKKKNKTILIPTLVIVSFYALQTLSILREGQIYSFVAFLLGIFAFVYMFLTRKAINSRIVLYFSFLYGAMVFSALITRNMEGGVFLNIQYIGISLLLLHHDLDHRVVAVSFYSHTLLMFGFIVLGLNPEGVLQYSRNQVSSIMISQAILVYISQTQKEKYSIIPSVVTTLICAWAMGRSGIISSFALMIASGRKSVKAENLKRGVIVMVVAVFVFSTTPGVISNVMSNVQVNYEVLKMRLRNEGLGSRALIIQEYFRIATLDRKSVIFGGEVATSDFMQPYRQNLHISFLGWHAYYGLLGFLLILIAHVKGLQYFVVRKQWFMLALLLVLLLRVSTDALAYPGYYDPLIYYFVLHQLGARVTRIHSVAS